MLSYYQTVRQVVRRFGNRFVIDTPADWRRTVFVAGTGRSGTTWLSEIINCRGEYRYIFEPFAAKRVPLAAQFKKRHYLRPDDEQPELKEIAEAILSGRVRSPWTERFNRRFIAHQRLIKAVRANMILKWLHQGFSEMPIILICRHPCAVAQSYLTRGWKAPLEPMLAQPHLVEDFLEPFQEHMARAEDTFERAVFVWCIETLVPLSQFRPGEIHVVFYENLVQHPERELDRLFRYIGTDRTADALDMVDRPSQTARRTSAIRRCNDLITSWQNKVTGRRLQRALDIVKLFGLDSIYNDDPMPRVDDVFERMSSLPNAVAL